MSETLDDLAAAMTAAGMTGSTPGSSSARRPPDGARTAESWAHADYCAAVAAWMRRGPYSTRRYAEGRLRDIWRSAEGQPSPVSGRRPLPMPDGWGRVVSAPSDGTMTLDGAADLGDPLAWPAAMADPADV